MNQIKSCGWVLRRYVGGLALLMLVLVFLTACQSGENSNASSASGGNGLQTSTVVSGAGTGVSSTSLDSSSSKNAACERMVWVTIGERIVSGKTHQYFFSPDHVTLKAGEFLMFSNQSDQVHVLRAVPEAELTNNTIDHNENQPVRFTRAGNYTIESQDPKHRAAMRVTVLSTVGSTCGISTPVATVTLTEQHPQVYTLAPKTVSMSAGQSLLLLNKTNQAYSFSCKPFAALAEGNLRVNPNEQQIVPFPKAGRYTCTTTEAPAEEVVVTVH